MEFNVLILLVCLESVTPVHGNLFTLFYQRTKFNQNSRSSRLIFLFTNSYLVSYKLLSEVMMKDIVMLSDVLFR